MKAVITCGGLGTRLLPFTKELPKEMAPVFYKTKNEVQVIPLIQLIFERLYDIGVRDFCFITGKTKRSIENHFTPDESSEIQLLKPFYKKLENSRIFWITQNSPKGFGDAVRYAESFVDKENFILHAGDVAVIKKNSLLNRLYEISKISEQDVLLSVRTVSDPQRHGIVELKTNDEISIVKAAKEKPKKPRTNLGIMPIYLFNYSIFKSLNEIKPGINNEIQLTDAIQRLIDDGKTVKAIRVDTEIFWDVGTPEAYWLALNESYKYTADI